MEALVDWEENVDLYVDDELSDSERRAFEARLENESDLRRSVDCVLELRKAFDCLSSTVPDGFAERLSRAIESQRESLAPKAKTRSKRDWSRAYRAKLPAFIGTIAALALVTLVAFSWFASHSQQDVSNGILAGTEEKKTSEIETILAAEQNWVRIPSAEGNASEASEKRLTQDQFWIVARINDGTQLKKQTGRFQRLCAELNVSFEKFGDDSEYILKQASTSQWRQLAEYLETIGKVEKSEAFERWLGVKTSEEQTDLRDARVSFKDAVEVE